MKRNVRIVVAAATTILAAATPAQQPTPTERHREMMPLHAMLIEKQKTQDVEIGKLLAEMNSATGEKRVDAIIAVINKLVEQRREMNAEFASHLDR